jgi:hypothetical protein
MSIAKLKLDEKRKIEFSLSITGADGAPVSRFIIEGKDFSLSFPCQQTNEGVEVEIGDLKKVLEAGEYPVKLEVIIDNKIYTPCQDTIVLEQNVEVQTVPRISATTVESVKLDKIEVRPALNEEKDAKIKIATLIAKSVGYSPSDKDNASSIIENSISSVHNYNKDKMKTLLKMLEIAESAGIKFARKFNEDALK